MLDFFGFTITEFSVANVHLPSIPCRAIVYDVVVNETDSEEGLGEINISFILFSSNFDEPMILEKKFSNWSVYGGIEAALECLITDDEVQGFPSLIGAVFNAEISFRVGENGVYDDFRLTEVIALPKP